MSNSPIIELENETGEFFLSQYGGTFAFGFKGDSDFINRCHNLVSNYSISFSPLYTFGDKMCYVTTNPDKILAGLTRYYFSQTIRTQAIPVESKGEEGDFEVSFNEAEATRIAKEKAEAFMASKVKFINFMFDNSFDRIQRD